MKALLNNFLPPFIIVIPVTGAPTKAHAIVALMPAVEITETDGTDV